MFLNLPQTQQKLSFIDKFIDILGLNYEEHYRLNNNIKEIEDHLNSAEDDLEELEEQLDTDGINDSMINVLQAEIDEINSQKEENSQIKSQLAASLKVVSCRYTSLISNRGI